MWRQRDGSNSILLVEGDTDRRLLRNFMAENCRVVGTDGKQNTIRVLEYLEKWGVDGVLAIIDDDYDRLEGRRYRFSNLFHTDTHDIETMIIRSHALDRVLAEFGDEERISALGRRRKRNVRETLLDLGVPIGYLRWMSEKNGWRLDFDDLPVDAFVNEEEGILDEAVMLRELLHRARHRLVGKTELELVLKSAAGADQDPWLICQGHDLVDLLALLFIKKQVKADWRERSRQVEGILRVAFTEEHFRQTDLCRELCRWEERNGRAVVRRVEAG